jgi:hypothetical protein
MSLPQSVAIRDYKPEQPVNPSTYFEENPAPRNLASHEARVEAFIRQHLGTGRRVALVTVSRKKRKRITIYHYMVVLTINDVRVVVQPCHWR